jgi:hypothetical protein
MTDAPPAQAEPTPTPHRLHDPELPARLRAVHIRTDDLVRLRIVFIAAIRLLGLVMAIGSLVLLASWLAEGIQDGDLWVVSYYWPRMATGVVLIGFGGGLALFGGLIGRAIVRARVGTVACPMCRFELTTLDRGRCTECGYEVSPALPDLAIGPVERVLAVRVVVAALARFVGVLLLGWAALDFLSFLAPTYFPELFDDYGYGYSSGYASILRAMVLLALAALFVFAARPLSAFLAPMSWADRLVKARAPKP